MKARFSVLGIMAAPVLSFAAYAAISPIFAIATPLAVSAGLAVWGAEAIRSRGLREEANLLTMWDQFPTTRALRLGVSDHDTARRRAEIELLTGETLPTREEEEHDLPAVDQKLARLVKRVLVQMQNSTAYGDMMLNENASYGFHRNMLAMRVPALIIVDLSIAINGVVAIAAGEIVTGLLVAALHGLLLASWLALVNERRVREQSERFAYRFWLNVEEMAAAQRRPKRGKTRLRAQRPT